MKKSDDSVPLEMSPPAKLPLPGIGVARAIAFRSHGLGHAHLAVLIGSPETKDAPLTRLHSACLTGDALGSLRCDCGPQLDAAMRAMQAEGTGILLYLDQEGRGIGLFDKIRAYALQDTGMDTVDANMALGHAADIRDFGAAASMLKALGFPAIRLLSNNPEKSAALTRHGVHVTERLPLKIAANPHNAAYLAAKAAKMGHVLE